MKRNTSTLNEPTNSEIKGNLSEIIAGVKFGAKIGYLAFHAIPLAKTFVKSSDINLERMLDTSAFGTARIYTSLGVVAAQGLVYSGLTLAGYGEALFLILITNIHSFIIAKPY